MVRWIVYGRSRVVRSALRHLLARRRGLDRCERLGAELAQDVEGAAAELARDRQTGAVVVDPPRHLPVVLVVG